MLMDRSSARGTAPGNSGHWRDRYVHRFYRSKPGWVDGTVEFFNLMRRHAGGARRALELGPGPQSPTTRFLAELCGAVDGLDLDPDIRSNPDLRQAIVYDGARWPIPDGSYDLICADFVLEHLQDPGGTLREAARVLSPGGVLFFRTPNLFHYVSIASRFTPHWFHVWAAKRLKGRTRADHDEYRTFYRVNTARAVRRLCKAAGLEELELMRVEKEPSYGSPARVLFLTLMAYERIVNSTALLAWARVNLFGAYRKPAAGSPAPAADDGGQPGRDLSPAAPAG